MISNLHHMMYDSHEKCEMLIELTVNAPRVFGSIVQLNKTSNDFDAVEFRFYRVRDVDGVKQREGVAIKDYAQVTALKERIIRDLGLDLAQALADSSRTWRSILEYETKQALLEEKLIDNPLAAVVRDQLKAVEKVLVSLRKEEERSCGQEAIIQSLINTLKSPKSTLYSVS